MFSSHPSSLPSSLPLPFSLSTSHSPSPYLSSSFHLSLPLTLPHPISLLPSVSLYLSPSFPFFILSLLPSFFSLLFFFPPFLPLHPLSASEVHSEACWWQHWWAHTPTLNECHADWVVQGGQCPQPHGNHVEKLSYTLCIARVVYRWTWCHSEDCTACNSLHSCLDV